MDINALVPELNKAIANAILHNQDKEADLQGTTLMVLRNLFSEHLKGCLAGAILYFGETVMTDDSREAVLVADYGSCPGRLGHAENWTLLEEIQTKIKARSGLENFVVVGSDLRVRCWYCHRERAWIQESF